MRRGNPVLKVARYTGREASLKLRNVSGSKCSEGWSQSPGKLSPSLGFKSKRPEFSSRQSLLAVCPWASHYSSLASVCSSVEWANTGSGFPAFLRGPNEIIYEKYMSAQYLAHCPGLSISFFSLNNKIIQICGSPCVWLFASTMGGETLPRSPTLQSSRYCPPCSPSCGFPGGSFLPPLLCFLKSFLSLSHSGHHLSPLLSLEREETETQGGEGTCPLTHSELGQG